MSNHETVHPPADVTLVAVHEKDFEAVRPLLRQFEKNTPELNGQKWRRLFTYPWKCDSLVRGFALKAGREFVGFRGCIQHVRQLPAGPHRIVSTTSWVVRPDFRRVARSNDGQRVSDLLLDAVDQWHENEQMTSVAISVRPELVSRFESRGYQVLETATVGLSTLANPRLDGWRIDHRPERVLAELDHDQTLLFDDHRQQPCLQILASRGGQTCHVIVCLRRSGRIFQLARIVHISDPEAFKSVLPSLGWFLLTRHRVRWLEWDSRWLQEIPAGARHRKLHSPRMFKSDVLKARDIDNLYSEIVLLEL